MTCTTHGCECREAVMREMAVALVAALGLINEYRALAPENRRRDTYDNYVLRDAHAVLNSYRKIAE